MLGLLGLMLILGSCKKDPVACFTPNRLAVIPNKFVTFFNCSAEATSYKWDFGDGNTSTDASPFNAYTTKGTYNVSLEALNESGDVSTISHEILIGDPGPFQIIIDSLAFPTGQFSSLIVELDGEELVSTTVGPFDIPLAIATSSSKVWDGNSANLRIITDLDDYTVNFNPQTDSDADLILNLSHPSFWSAYIVLIGR
ncbi:MAG TPA: PKD domain-containing protein [Bacteroidetes bacterium]|nr:PKD domain-containing protein [Bacteroidota bacterium]